SDIDAKSNGLSFTPLMPNTSFQCQLLFNATGLLSSTTLSVLMEMVMQASEVIAFGSMSIILLL
ncbi:MAG: hypothetical protein ACTHJ2_02640, partial [Candidatus Nitrosocosmicus sp.]